MKQKHNAGFSLIEILVAIVLLGAIVVPTCTSLVMSVRMNARTEEMMQAQLAVSSAVETLMAEGIDPDRVKTYPNGESYGWVKVTINGVEETIDQFPELTINAVAGTDDSEVPYYQVTVTDNEGLVSVTTYIRADTTPAPTDAETEEGGGT